MTDKQFESVWYAIKDTPEEAKDIETMSELMMELATWIKKENLTHLEAAHHLDVGLKTIDDLMNGKINRFTLEELVRLYEKANIEEK